METLVFTRFCSFILLSFVGLLSSLLVTLYTSLVQEREKMQQEMVSVEDLFRVPTISYTDK